MSSFFPLVLTLHPVVFTLFPCHPFLLLPPPHVFFFFPKNLHSSISLPSSLLSLPLDASRKPLLVIINLQPTKHTRGAGTRSQAHDTLDIHTHQHFCTRTHMHSPSRLQKSGSCVAAALREKRQLSHECTNSNTVPNPLCRSLFAVHKSMYTS